MYVPFYARVELYLRGSGVRSFSLQSSAISLFRSSFTFGVVEDKAGGATQAELVSISERC